MSEHRETWIPFFETPVTLNDDTEPDEMQLELFKKLQAIGPLRVPRRCNYYQAIEERAEILGLSLTHEEIYPLAIWLNRNFLSTSDKKVNAKVNESDPSTWTGPKLDLFNQIKGMFPEGVFANPAILKTDPNFTIELNTKIQKLNSQERRKVLEWLRNSSIQPGIQSKLRIEVSDQHYSLSYYNASGHQEFIGNRRQQYSDVAVLTSTPKSAMENLDRILKDLQDMPVTASDFTRASLFRNLVRAIAASQTGDSIDWYDITVDDQTLQSILETKGMDVLIEGETGSEKLTLLSRTPSTRAIFAMYAQEVGVGQVLNQTKYRGAHLAEGLRMALLDFKAPQTALIHLKHIATSLRTAANPEVYNELLSGINQSLAKMLTPHAIAISDGQVRLLRSGVEIQNMYVQLDAGSAQSDSAESNRLQSLLSNPEKIRILRKAIESLAIAKTPHEKLQAAAIFLQEGMDKTSFYKDGKNYTFSFHTTKVDGDLKNVEISIKEAESLTSTVLAKGLISIRGKNVRVIESATAI